MVKIAFNLWLLLRKHKQKQAGAEVGQAQVKLEPIIEVRNYDETHIEKKKHDKREQASKISGGMFLPCGFSLASDWLPGYGHCVPAPLL